MSICKFVDTVHPRVVLVVYGYIRKIQGMLSYFRIIPNELAQICLSYIDNHFLLNGSNSGNYIWCIKDIDTIYKIFNSSCGECFKSQIFTIANLKWRILLYPNGNDQFSENNVKISIKLMKYPSSCSEITLYRTIYCHETMSSYTTIKPYHNNKDIDGVGWFEDMLLLSDLININPKQITIQITLNILQLIYTSNTIPISYLEICNKQINNTIITPSIPKHQHYIFNINEYEMIQMKSANNGKCMDWLTCNRQWCLMCYPNGESTDSKGYLSLYIGICFLPTNVQGLKIKFELICKETGISETCTSTLCYPDRRWGYGTCEFMEFNQIKSFDTLTFEVDINILEIEMEKDIMDTSFAISNEKHINEILSVDRNYMFL